MIRANLTVTVRSTPVRRVFKGSKGEFAVFLVDLLDSDYNKCEGRITEEQIGALGPVFGSGAVVDIEADITAYGGRLQVAVQQAAPHTGKLAKVS